MNRDLEMKETRNLQSSIKWNPQKTRKQNEMEIF